MTSVKEGEWWYKAKVKTSRNRGYDNLVWQMVVLGRSWDWIGAGRVYGSSTNRGAIEEVLFLGSRNSHAYLRSMSGPSGFQLQSASSLVTFGCWDLQTTEY